MKTLIYCITYNSEFIKQANSGWECGYIMIPSEHPFIVAMMAIEAQDYEKDPENYSFYVTQIPKFSEEISFCEDDELEGIKYKRLGFDCAHYWNTMENSNRNFVISKTMEMQRIVESYK